MVFFSEVVDTAMGSEGDATGGLYEKSYLEGDLGDRLGYVFSSYGVVI